MDGRQRYSSMELEGKWQQAGCVRVSRRLRNWTGTGRLVGPADWGDKRRGFFALFLDLAGRDFGYSLAGSLSGGSARDTAFGHL